MKTKHLLLGMLILFGCDLYSTYSKDNQNDCTTNILLCGASESCNPVTAQCEPGDMAGPAVDLADPPPDLMPPPPPPTGFMFFPQTPALTQTAMQVSGLAAGDLNQDGYPEVVYTDASANAVGIFKNTSGTGFDAAIMKTVGTSPAAPRIADLNGDGKFDIVNVNTNSGNITLQYGDGALGFPMHDDVAVSGTPVDLTIGNVFGDARPAIVTANPQAGTISVVRNTTGPSLYNTYSAGSNPSSVALGQFDSTDGNGLDVVVANRGSTQDTILINNGTLLGLYALLSTHAISTGGQAFSVTSADFDGDNRTDVVSVVPLPTPQVRICFNNGASGCKSSALLTPEGTPALAVAGDFTGDGKLDLAVTNRGAKSVSVFASDNGKFSAPITIATPIAPYYIATGDFNSDGKLDLVVADQISTIVILRNTSTF